MRRNQVFYALIGAVIFIALIFLIPWMIQQGKNAKTERPISSIEQPSANIAGPTDRCDTAYYAKAYAKELNEARVAYQDYQDALDCYQVEMTKQNQSVSQTTTTTKKVRSSGSTMKKSVRKAPAQNLESEFLSADRPAVATRIKEGGPKNVEFCVKVGQNYWPQIGLDNGDVINNTIINFSGDGHNIKMPPVSQIDGLLFAPTDDRKIYIDAEILDRYGANEYGVSVGCDYNHWSTWIPAYKEGNFYVADFSSSPQF
ncbi:MAG: hypothetical protein ACM3PZ_02815 [Bacillota bacterium]